MPWNAIATSANQAMNFPVQVGMGITGLVQARKQRDLQDYYNQENLALAKEAFSAQQNQQALENEWYLDERDYQRTLQQQIFTREDTAMQRARDDFVAAGFSPLAAVGNMANAGQVVASASSPGNMVSNNQASTQVSNFVGDALNNMASHLDSASGRALTELMASKQMAHDKDMAEFSHDKALELKTLEIQGALMNTMASATAQQKLQELIGNQNLDAVKQQGQNAMDLQNDQQSWLESQPQSRSPDQIAEQFFNWLQKEDPLIGEITKGYQGWEIGFKVVKELVVRQFSSVFNKSENPYSPENVEKKLGDSPLVMPEGWF